MVDKQMLTWIKRSIYHGAQRDKILHAKVKQIIPRGIIINVAKNDTYCLMSPRFTYVTVNKSVGWMQSIMLFQYCIKITLIFKIFWNG